MVKWSNSSIWVIDGTLSSVSTPGQSGPGNNGNEGVLDISQIFKTEALVVSYPAHSLARGGKGSYPSAKMQSAYSAAPAKCAVRWEVSDHIDAVLLGASFRICSKQQAASWCSSHLDFSRSILLESKWCNYTVVLTATIWKNFHFKGIDCSRQAISYIGIWYVLFLVNHYTIKMDIITKLYIETQW